MRENTAKVEQSNAEINSTPKEKHYHTLSPHSALLTKFKEVVSRAGSSATIRYDWLEKNKLLVRSFFYDGHHDARGYRCNYSHVPATLTKRHCAPLLDLRAAKSANALKKVFKLRTFPGWPFGECPWYFPRAGKSAGGSVLLLENPDWYEIWGE